MIEIRPNEQRGPTRLDWLDSRHTFSFGSYFDPRYQGVSVLRVINDDRVLPGAGFAPHSHRDMEIISYVKKGVMEHRDSLGNVGTVPAGEVQLMSAGTGITHSEFNSSTGEPLEFLQIWIEPDTQGVAPSYQQQRLQDTPGLQPIAAPGGRDGAMRLHQDAYVYRLVLEPGQVIDYPLARDRVAYLHGVAGGAVLHETPLQAGDGATLRDIARIELRAVDHFQALLFDLP